MAWAVTGVLSTEKERVLLSCFGSFWSPAAIQGSIQHLFISGKHKPTRNWHFQGGSWGRDLKVSSEALSGQRQQRGDRVTARRERGRKKEKTEKERSVLGGRSCTRLGSLSGRAGDSSTAARVPVPPWAGGIPSGVQRSCLPFPWGFDLFPCISTKRCWGKINVKGLC